MSEAWKAKVYALMTMHANLEISSLKQRNIEI